MSWFKSLLGQSPSVEPSSPAVQGAPASYPPAPPAWQPAGPPEPPKPPAPPKEMACSFCGTSRAEVNKLVAGPNDVTICDACIAACADVVAHGDNGDSLKCARNLVVRELAGMTRPVDFAVSSKLVAAALLLAGGEGATCRQIAATAVHVGDHASAALAFGAIRHADHTLTDRINEALSYETAGAPRAGLALLDAVDPARCTLEQRTIVPLHRLSFRLTAGLADRAEAETAERITGEVEVKLPELKVAETYEDGLRREILLVRARAARVLGNPDRAVTLLRGHLQRPVTDPVAWALLYEIHADQRKLDDALAAKAKALSLLHPENTLALALRARTP